MLLQPEFPENPLGLIVSKKNKRIADALLSNGMKPEKIRQLLMRFFSFKVVLREIFKSAKNPEWIKTLAWQKTIERQYRKAIQNLEMLLSNESIPSTTRETIIKKDVKELKHRKNILTHGLLTKPTMTPEPISIQQMLNFQSYALYQYLKRFKGGATDLEIYELIAELFRKLYRDTALNKGLKDLDGKALKNRFVDNAEKLRGKYADLENAIKPFISK